MEDSNELLVVLAITARDRPGTGTFKTTRNMAPILITTTMASQSTPSSGRGEGNSEANEQPLSINFEDVGQVLGGIGRGQSSSSNPARAAPAREQRQGRRESRREGPPRHEQPRHEQDWRQARAEFQAARSSDMAQRRDVKPLPKRKAEPKGASTGETAIGGPSTTADKDEFRRAATASHRQKASQSTPAPAAVPSMPASMRRQDADPRAGGPARENVAQAQEAPLGRRAWNGRGNVQWNAAADVRPGIDNRNALPDADALRRDLAKEQEMCAKWLGGADKKGVGANEKLGRQIRGFWEVRAALLCEAAALVGRHPRWATYAHARKSLPSVALFNFPV